MKNYKINRLSSKEQSALHFIKMRIAEHIKPLLIYCWNSQVNYKLQRNCFINESELEEWVFSCCLLVVMPEESFDYENLQKDISALTISYGTVHTKIHSLNVMAEKIKEYNLFFNWVNRNAILLYERGNAMQLLPAQISDLEEYRRQADNYYKKNPEMLNYMEEKLNYVGAPVAVPGVVNHNTGDRSIGILIANNYVDDSFSARNKSSDEM